MNRPDTALLPGLLVACGLLAAGVASAQPTAAFAPSRSHGVAPLYVFFDATTTTHSDGGIEPFSDLEYVWTFSDFDAGTWQTSGKDKNRALGPVAAHVFDEPGSYLVMLRVVDEQGQTSTVSHRIAVQDPNAVFHGSSTLCFSNDTDFAGCPTASQHITTSSFAEALSHAAPGRRLLLARGDSFDANEQATIDEGPGVIGAFGSGPRPIVTSSLDVHMIRTRPAEDWRIMDLDIRGSGIGGQDRLVKGEKEGSRQLLFYRLDMTGFGGNAILLHHLQIDSSNGERLHQEIAVVDCNVTDNTQNMVFIAAEHLAVMGNVVTDGEHHLVRSPFSSPGVFQHNVLARAGTGQFLLLKIHSGDFTPVGGAGTSVVNGRYNEKFIVSDNQFTGAEWSVALAPQSSSSEQYDERVRRVIVERNVFRSDANTQNHLVIRASHVTVRNNILDFSVGGGSGKGGINIGDYDVLLETPTGNRVYNNTCRSLETSHSVDIACVRTFSGVLDTVVRNNLLMSLSPSAAPLKSEAGPETVESNNVLTVSSPFVEAAPQMPEEYALDPSALAVDGGYDIRTTRLDFFEKRRPLSGVGSPSQVDVGAIEGSVDPVQPIAAPEIVTE